jgi:hypothetical protein
MKNYVHLTEMSILELLDGKEIYDDDTIIIPPKTDELQMFKRCKPIIEKIKKDINYPK